jgi:hypothetical protein
MNDTLQQFDRYDSNNPRQRPDVEDVMATNAAKQFRADYPDFYPSDRNAEIIKSFLEEKNVPVSRRNLGIAYECLRSRLDTEPQQTVTHKTIRLTPSERGVQTIKSGLILRHDNEGVAGSELLREKPERLKELAGETLASRQAEDAANRELAGPAGSPVSKAMKIKWLQSLSANKRKNVGEARAYIAELHPTLDSRSQEFNRLVALLLNS